MTVGAERRTTLENVICRVSSQAALAMHIDFDEAQTLAQRSLEAQMATEVRHQVAAFMERRGMGGLIRGGL